MAWRVLGLCVTSALVWGLSWEQSTRAEESRFAMTHSRSQYVHWIDLYDATENRIDPTDPNAAPYSPFYTCGRCHDYASIAHGFHFNAMEKLQSPGRAGEPWIWTDTRTGTQIPLSYRKWPGTYDPRDLGISAWDFVLKFGRQMPGGGPGAGGVPQESQADAEVSARDEEREDDEHGPQADPAQPDPSPAETSTGSAEPAGPVDNGRWHLSGKLAIDCMFCHSKDDGYSQEIWWEQVSKQNFAWAPAAALGIADIVGDVSKIKETAPDEEKPDEEKSETSETSESGEASAGEGDAVAKPAAPKGPELPKTTYRSLVLNSDKKVFFDVIRKPSNNACYYCHTTRVVGSGATPDWTHDEDVHLRAGMSCSDCHRNGIEHETVRGFEGETRADGVSIVTLSCRGCHLGEPDGTNPIPGGRMGAPKPLHRGLPPVHLTRLSCTACHSGPRPTMQALQVQTAMAHALGLPTHHLDASTEPAMVAPVMLQSDDVLYPHRMVWPAFWGEMKEDQITPLNPEVVQEALRRVLRVRRNSTFTETLGKASLSDEDKVALLGEQRAKVSESDLNEEERAKLRKAETEAAVKGFREKLAEALKEFQSAIKTQGAQGVYVAGGRVYRLGAGDQVEVFSHAAAEPYAWKLAHDVRPARFSSGATGCFECHSLGSPMFDGQVTAMGPAPDAEPPTSKMAELAGYDRTQIDVWNLSFQGRTAFKWFGFASASIVAVVLLSFVLLGVNGFFGLFRRS